jgi:hypothetical protein
MVRKSKKKIVQTEEESVTAASTLIEEMDEIGDTKNQCHLCDDDTWYEDADLQKHIAVHITEINSVI